MTVPANRRLPSGSRNEFGTTDIDIDFGDWFERVLLLDMDSPNRVVLASASASWLGVFDPSVHSLRQCWIASTYVKQYLASYGFDAVVAPVDAAILHHGVQVSAVGTAAPGKVRPDGMWDGHSVLLIPALGALLDLTLGQDKVLGADRNLRLPVFAEGDAVPTAVVDGLTFTVDLDDRPGYAVRYTFHDMDPGYEHSKQGRLLMREALLKAGEESERARSTLLPYLADGAARS